MALVVCQHHNHKPNRTEEQIEVRNSVKNMLKRAETENVSAGEIYRDEAKKRVLAKESEEAAVNLPSYREVQGSIYNRKHLKFPELPKDLQDFKLHEDKWKNSLIGNRRFLLHDSEKTLSENNRITIFASDDQIKFLSTCKRWGF
jgi:hypothetical protein